MYYFFYLPIDGACKTKELIMGLFNEIFIGFAIGEFADSFFGCDSWGRGSLGEHHLIYFCLFEFDDINAFRSSFFKAHFYDESYKKE